MPKVAFWHKPEKPVYHAPAWHAYDKSGHSLCGLYALIGTGRPRVALNSRPASNVCKKCSKLADKETS